MCRSEYSYVYLNLCTDLIIQYSQFHTKYVFGFLWVEINSNEIQLFADCFRPKYLYTL